ncbi:hypothetical protein D9M71_755180 [compost metagenome]
MQGLESDVGLGQAVTARGLLQLLDRLVGWGGEQDLQAGGQQAFGNGHDAGGLAGTTLANDRQALEVRFEEAGNGPLDCGRLASVELHV